MAHDNNPAHNKQPSKWIRPGHSKIRNMALSSAVEKLNQAIQSFTQTSSDVLDKWLALQQTYVREYRSGSVDRSFHEWILQEEDNGNVSIEPVIELLYREQYHRLVGEKRALIDNICRRSPLGKYWQVYFILGEKLAQSRICLRVLNSITKENPKTGLKELLAALQTARGKRVRRCNTRSSIPDRDILTFTTADIKAAAILLVGEPESEYRAMGPATPSQSKPGADGIDEHGIDEDGIDEEIHASLSRSTVAADLPDDKNPIELDNLHSTPKVKTEPHGLLLL
jgi:hypothetical protein